MKAIETTAIINNQGQLHLDSPIKLTHHQRVRVIILISENEEENNPDDTPKEVVLEGLREGLKEALTGETIPVSEMCDDIDVE